MSKSPDAFRTISEVAEWLEKPAHVLRFWESKFPQVKPVKRAGGRRYYRPEDMMLLGGIKKLLHDDGMTIKGAQKIVREQGVRYVSGLSQPLDDVVQAAIAAQVVDAATLAATDQLPEPYALDVEPEPETATVIAFSPASEAARPAQPEAQTESQIESLPASMPAEPVSTEPVSAVPAPEEPAPEEPAPASSFQPEHSPPATTMDAELSPETSPPEPQTAAALPEDSALTEVADNGPPDPNPADVVPDSAMPDAMMPDDVIPEDVIPADDLAHAPLPSFMRAPTPRAPAVPPLSRPQIPDVPPMADTGSITGTPGLLSTILARKTPLASEHHVTARAARDRLIALRGRMAQGGSD